VAPYGTFTSGDGVDIVLSVQNQREWMAFCETVLGDVRLAVDKRFDSTSRRVENRGDLDNMIAAAFSGRTGAEMQARLDQARIANARQREIADVLNHPQLVTRKRWHNVETPEGTVRAVLPAITTVGQTPRMGPVPALGEHSAAILAELGYGAAVVATTPRDAL
jgi:crotonobetainyl-CoA:carnitine CoA-transferase CaiB-like acyl-CoA transferase